MSISPIVTYGLGTYGGVNLLPTLGFSIGEVVIIVTPVDVELVCQITTSLSFTVLIETDRNYIMDLSNE